MERRSKFFFALGILLLLGSIGLFVASQLQTLRAQVRVAEVLAQMDEVLPERSAGVTDTYLSMEMPALSVEGQDFIAVVDIPALGLRLPVYGDWESGAVTSFPCRFCGTVYDGSLVIGGSDQPGQFDSFEHIQPGAEVTVTDMTGAEFSYVVSRIDRTNSAESAVLRREPSDLTLFVRDAYGLDYVVVRCMAG